MYSTRFPGSITSLAQTGDDSVDMEDAKEFARKAKAEPVSAKLGAISQSLPESPSLHRETKDKQS